VHGFHRTAPPLAAFRSFLLDKLASDSPCIVAVNRELIAGYCDLSPLKPDGFMHVAKPGHGGPEITSKAWDWDAAAVEGFERSCADRAGTG